MSQAFSAIVPIEKMKFDSIGKLTSQSDASENVTGSFSSLLNQSLQEVYKLNGISETDNAQLALGNADNLAQIQINALKATTAVQTTVQLVSRAVNAYKEIMQMQV